jgi:serine/threonine protein kinase
MPELIRKTEPGDVIGRCRTIRELGRGGVGTVYLATHQTLQIEVALKVLSPSLSMDNPALAERFIREAQLAARIRHPNVIAVMDAGHDESTGLYYIVMEYVSGGSLSWHLRHGALPEAKALSIITGIAHALLIAEENSIVHRDIKPDNIILDLRGTAKLADLGLAKHSIDSRTSLTMGGSFMGTPAYMSPEQARDAKVADTRDDIYSLGATFYECLTGEPPFQGETPYNIMSELLTKPSPKPSTLHPEISRAADLICRKMMAKNRDLRYANARALLDDLQICQTFGDSAFDRLEAASFSQDSLQVRQEALVFGVETSTDGVYVHPDSIQESDAARKMAESLLPPRKSGTNVFAVAMLLLTLVVLATLVLVWLGPLHPLTTLKSEVAQISPPAIVVPPPQETPPPTVQPVKPSDTHDLPSLVYNPPTENTPVMPNEKEPPRALPVEPVPAPTPRTESVQPTTSDVPNPQPAVPVQPAETVPDTTVPALPATPDSAFVARSVAEGSPNVGSLQPNGQAELLRIVGKRDDAEVTPSVWTFYFFDKTAPGHARIISVANGKVIKNGGDLEHFAVPYTEQNILPEDKVLIDSGQALQIAQNLIPDVKITSSQFELLQQKNSVPMWKVTLWTKDGDDDRKLGDVTLLAENGTLISKNLKP